MMSRSRTTTSSPVHFLKSLTPYDTKEINILLLENIHLDAVAALRSQGYQVEHATKALPEDQLIEKIKDVHVIGIRCVIYHRCLLRRHTDRNTQIKDTNHQGSAGRRVKIDGHWLLLYWYKPSRLDGRF